MAIREFWKEMRFRGKAICLVLSLVMLFSIPQAHATTECEVKVAKIWIGEDAIVWIHFTNGGSFQITSSTYPNRESVISLATTALVGGRSIIVRYQSDGVNCAGYGRSDFVGMYLL